MCLLHGRNWMCKYIWVAGLNFLHQPTTSKINNNSHSCSAKIDAWIKVRNRRKQPGRPKILPKTSNAAQWLCVYVCTGVTRQKRRTVEMALQHRVKSVQLSPWRYKVAEELRLPAPRCKEFPAILSPHKEHEDHFTAQQPTEAKSSVALQTGCFLNTAHRR